MNLSFINSEFSDNIDEAIAFAKKNNLKYIELEKIDGKLITDIDTPTLLNISSKISSAGILVSAINSSFLKWSISQDKFCIFGQPVENEEKYFEYLMDIADIFGAPFIRIFSYTKSEISIDELAQKLDIYSQKALDRGISLVLENDGLCNIDTISKMHQLFELYNFSNITPLLNMGNVASLNDDYKLPELQDIINTCQYFHIKDYDAELKRFVVIGEGNIDYEAIIKEKASDTSVIFSLEPHTGYPEDLQMSVNMLLVCEDN